MAPSASMLFLSYHQLHQPAAPPRRKEETTAAAAGGGGFRLTLSSRREAPATAEGEALRERGVGEDTMAAAAAAGNKELEEKFEEALRLSCCRDACMPPNRREGEGFARIALRRDSLFSPRLPPAAPRLALRPAPGALLAGFLPQAPVRSP
ncbi:hypothetical protein HU200_047733 [Digitaria exilis]|uniref:Uncharacterized protein n=1 Tax=Digitaria exilis TaxID=1010633 RepID=A0A835AWE0_9POAL|nr:hypothetical protein HU200_047733 [Digitaria exilis]